MPVIFYIQVGVIRKQQENKLGLKMQRLGRAYIMHVREEGKGKGRGEKRGKREREKKRGGLFYHETLWSLL